MTNEAVKMTMTEFNYLLENYYNLDKEQKEELKLKFTRNLKDRNWLYGRHPTIDKIEKETAKQINEVYSEMNFTIMRTCAEYDGLTIKNLGSLNYIWLQELRNYLVELYSSMIIS